jgi:hypothetical protein
MSRLARSRPPGTAGGAFMFGVEIEKLLKSAAEGAGCGPCPKE